MSNSSDTVQSKQSSVETEVLMPEGSRYARESLDVSSRRSIVIKPDEKAKELIREKDTYVVVDYFYHDDKFWRAIIPLDGVDQIYGQSFNFSRPRTRRTKDGPQIIYKKDGLPKRTNLAQNHLQSRFKFHSDQPVELYPLGSETSAEPAHRIHDMIYSLEAAGPPGVTYNLRDGLMGNLISAHRFLSIHEMVFERLVVGKQYITESPPLPLKEHEKRALLIGSLLRSHRAGMTEFYYLYRFCGTNNCTSSPFQILDRVVKYGFHQRIGSALYRFPISPRFYLWVRGLDSDPKYRKLLRSEFEDFIADPKIQSRKREVVRRQIRLRRAALESRDTA